MKKFYFVEYREAGSNHDWEPIDDECAAFDKPADSLERIKDCDWGRPIEVRATLFVEVPLDTPEEGDTRHLYIGHWSGDLHEDRTTGLCDSLTECVVTQQAIVQDGGESGGWAGFLGFAQLVSVEEISLGVFTAQGHPV